MIKPIIVVYTHTDYRRVWPLWFGQTSKYMTEYEKVIFVNDSSNEIPSEYRIITYDEELTYKDRVISCLSQLNQDDIIIFHHEDMFLYDQPMHHILVEFTRIVKNNSEKYIKLLRAGEGLHESKLHEFLYLNPEGLTYSIQPTIIKVEKLLDIYSRSDGNTIWEFESNAGRQVNKNQSYYYYNGESLRGSAHYNSNIYPYVATAIVKGHWNMSEYGVELKLLFDEYKINNF
jgi:hypothetical protein